MIGRWRNGSPQAPSARRVLVVQGHPNEASFCAALAARYVEASRTAGNEVRLLSVAALQFDPILRAGHGADQALEPDLVAAQQAIAWAQHLVFVYPIWWGAMPAPLKGFLDRVLLPGFAFKYRGDSPWWDRLLAGRSAQLLVTMDTPPWYYRWVFRMPGHHQMKRAILEFCGVRPVAIRSFGPIKGSKPEQRTKWLRQAADCAGRG